MDVSTTIKKLGIEKMFKYLYKDPEKNLPKLMDWADKFCGEEFPSQRAAVREAVENPEDPYYHYLRHMINDVDPEVLKTVAVNFFIKAAGHDRKGRGQLHGYAVPGERRPYSG